MNDTVALIVGFVLTLFIYSYLVGDNPLYRIAVHILVGVSAAYATVVATRAVFIPLAERILANPSDPANLLWVVPILLGLLLLMTWIRPVAWFGNSAIGFLVAVGAAVALVGVISGTLLPQIIGAAGPDPLLGIITALLTIAALLYFQFSARHTTTGEVVVPAWQRSVAAIGRGVLMITFGALFAGALSTGLVLLVERLGYYVAAFTELFGL